MLGQLRQLRNIQRDFDVKVIVGLVLLASAYHVFVSPQAVTMNPPPAYKLRNQQHLWALVTGSCKGIGLGYAKELLKRGYSVIITGTSEASIVEGLATLKGLLPPDSIQQVEGFVLDVYNLENVKHQMKRLFDSRNLRVIVYHAFPDMFVPLYNTKEFSFQRLADANVTGLATALQIATRHWMQNDQIGVFIGSSATTAYCRFGGAEFYGATRAFQSEFLSRSAESFLSTSSKYANARTRNILIVCAEIPMVDTKTLRTAMQENKHLEPIIMPISWDADVYTERVLHRALDKGHSFISEGVGYRFLRMLSHVIPINMGDAGGMAYSQHMIDTT